MGCVSSSFIEGDAAAGKLTPEGFSHHIVSLTSTTYGLFTTFDQPSTSPPFPHPPLPTFPSTAPHLPQPEIINSWELMAGLEPLTPPMPSSNPRMPQHQRSLDLFEKRCPPGGEKAVVLYTTTLRGIRKTFDDCNAVRAALEVLGVQLRERDVSMDLGFREELRRLVGWTATVPRVFICGRYIGGAEQVLQIHERGGLGVLVEGLPKVSRVGCCGCGGARFLPCFRCKGSRKRFVPAEEGGKGNSGGVWRRVRCPECNENGLKLCPICT